MKMPFKRKNNDSVVPAEIQNYYQSERNERPGVAWLLAFGTLVVTLVLALALFFGGRFVYRKIVDKDAAPVTSQPADNQATPGNEASETGDSAQTTPSTPAPTTAPTPAPSNTPSTPAPTTGSLPNTGPDSE